MAASAGVTATIATAATSTAATATATAATATDAATAAAFPHFTESECSLPQSQAPVTCPYPEPDQSRAYLPIPLIEDLF